MTEPICLDAEVRPIPGYAGYAVTADGTIYGPAGRPLLPSVDPDGHLHIKVSRRPGVPRKLFLHRAVLLAWVGPCPSGQECRHADGDPANNRVGNLGWGTRGENLADRVRLDESARGEAVASSKLTAAEVAEIRRLRSSTTLRALAARYGVCHTAILRATNGERRRHVQ